MATVDIEKTMEAHRDELMDVPGVVGIGIGQSQDTGERFISVLVDQMTPELEALLPEELEGFAVKTETTGPIQIQNPPDQ